MFRSALFEQLAINLAAIVFRKRRNEFNPARIFVRREFRLNEFFQLFSEQILITNGALLYTRATVPIVLTLDFGHWTLDCFVFLPQYHKGFRFYEPVTRIVTDNRAF